MIGKASRGGDFGGLVRYLAGDGKRNEHTDQHVIGGDPLLVRRVGFTSLDGDAQAVERAAVAEHLEFPHRLFGTELMYARVERDPISGEQSRVSLPGHVWHCSLSLPVDDGRLTDAMWEKIAGDFVARMGFDGADGQAPCRWVAVRHGASANGNDHIHIALSLVRDDGSPASLSYEHLRVNRACRELEAEYGLTRLDSRTIGAGRPGFSMGDALSAERRGDRVPDRVRLERAVRAVAAAAETERIFVQGLRADGLLVRARFEGKNAVGYSVAVDRGADVSPIWFGGASLARDLSLNRLRSGWEASLEDHSRPSPFLTATSSPGIFASRDEAFTRPWRTAAQRAADAADRLAVTPSTDTHAWVSACRDTAGAFAAWAKATETDGVGPLTDTARELSRLASTHLRDYPGRAEPPLTPASVSGGRLATDVALLLQVSGGRSSSRANEAMLAVQLGRMVEAVVAWKREAGLLSQASSTAKAWGGVRDEYLPQLGVATAPVAPDRRQQLLGTGLTAEQVEQRLHTEKLRADAQQRDSAKAPAAEPAVEPRRDQPRGFDR